MTLIWAMKCPILQLENTTVRTRLEAGAQNVKGYWPSEPSTINLQRVVRELGLNELDNGQNGFER